RFYPLSRMSRGDDAEEYLAVALELAAADAGDFRESGAVARALARHRLQRGVVEDHVGRHALFPRQREAFGAERLPQGGIVAAEPLHGSAARPFALRAGNARGLVAERHRR